LGQVWFDTTSPPDVTGTVPPQLSLAVIPAGLAAGTRFAQETVAFTGQLMTGGIGSLTMMDWVQLAVAPQASDT
jgi:hypothetical protein